jgi:ribosomal protein L11 methyltransferase
MSLTKRLSVVPLVRGHRALTSSDIGLVPELAFGFGEHPTTRLAARRVEEVCLARSGASLLDVGTGSGVLSIVADRCGAARVVGIDTSLTAVDAARRNVASNAASSVRIHSTPVEDLDATFDVVVANIDARTLVSLCEPLGRRLARGGELILSGLLTEDEAIVAREYEAAGLGIGSRTTEGDWLLLTAGYER